MSVRYTGDITRSLFPMDQPTKLWTAVALLAVIVVAGGAYAYFSHNRAPIATVPANTVSYSCAQGTITANYATSSVALVLSDGRSFTLPQVVSGSGIRYEDKVGTTSTDVTFSSKGSDAFLEEDGSVTYSDCVAGTVTVATTTPSGIEKTFLDSSGTFSFNYVGPVVVSGGGIGYTTDWMNNATTSGLVLAVATLPSSFEPSTNFQGAKLTIGTSADPSALAECLTYNESGGPVTAPTQQTINGVTYAVFKSSDAGAGNFYDTMSYRTLRNSQCYAVEYTVHTTNIGNYSPDQGITAYDAAKVTTILNNVVQSFKFLGPNQTTPQQVSITNADDMGTVRVALGAQVALTLGSDLNWSNVQAVPSSVLTRETLPLPSGVQAIFSATGKGTATITASGGAICKPGQACPQFLRAFTVTVVVGS